MIDGYMSFAGFEGKAHYHGTPIEEILPVEIAPYDDRVETHEGIRPGVTNRSHPILLDVEDSWPPLLGNNRVKVKADAQLLLERERDPILAVRNCGRGRTAAFTSDLSPHWGSNEFIKWSHYSRFWRQLLNWLATNSDH